MILYRSINANFALLSNFLYFKVVKKTAQVIRIISKTLNILLVSIIVVLAVLLGGIRLFGLTPYTVLSGSMEPTYHVGSVIYVSDVSADELKVGDPLTYHLSSGIVVTHRINEILNQDSQPSFIVKGDANDYVDGEPVPQSAIIGRPVFSIPYLGYVSEYVTHPSGLITVAIICIAVLILSFGVDAILKVQEPKPDDTQETEEA